MKKLLLISMLALGLLSVGFAQDENKGSDFGPAAGDITGAVLFGNANFISSGMSVVSSPGGSWTVPGTAPNFDAISAGTNSITNMVGLEGKYYITDVIAAKISGGAIFRTTPPMDFIPGYYSANDPIETWIPDYAAVKQDNKADFNLNIGGEYVFPSSKFDRMFPYVGANFPFYYGRRLQYDPTIDMAANIVDVGIRTAEVYGWGMQAVAGVDYYLAKGLYMGVEFKPISYVYLKGKNVPGPGLEARESKTHTISYFSQIYFKLGFRF